MIKRSEFILLLEDFPEDAEQYDAIRDSLSLYEDYSSLDIRCYACGSQQHLLTKCQYIHHKSNKDKVILLHNKTVIQERESGYTRTSVRTENMRHREGLSYLAECARECVSDHAAHPKVGEYVEYLDNLAAFFA